MNEQVSPAWAGWTVGSSLAMEIDLALTTIGGYFPGGSLPEELARLVRAVPPDWLAEWPELLGESGRMLSILGHAAFLADSLLEEDYARATLAIRELTADSALARIADRATALGLVAKEDLSPPGRLLDVWSRLIVATYAAVGYRITPEHPLAQRTHQDLARLVRILRDGDLHARFWHWLDRFFYQVYQPWRQTRAEALRTLEQRAIVVLGAQERRGTPPPLAWLPAQNPLLRVPELQAAVQAGQLHVHFWVEPFGLADTMDLQPGLVLVSFAAPGILYDNFQAVARDLAGRAQALADPTRLIILRIIRHFGLPNTEIAEFLGLARPTVSVHAKILREAGLIHSTPEGRLVRHEIEPGELRRLFRDLQQFLDLPPEPAAEDPRPDRG